MKAVPSRATLALVLTGIALLVPCGAWYVVGTRELERTTQLILDAPRQLAGDLAPQLAAKLHDRFEVLREMEDRRPYYQYQALYHDPKGASEGASVVPSPLAEGPGDPMIHGYFQVEPAGQVTLPTLSAEAFAQEDLHRAAVQRSLQQELELAVPVSSCVAQLEQRGQPQRVEVLEGDAYWQITQAGKIYSEIKTKGGNVTEPLPRKDTASDTVKIGVGAFQWCTMTLSNRLALVALRTIDTPDGKRVQGFVISQAAVLESLKGAALPARFRPGARSGEYMIAAPVAGTDWFVVVDLMKEAAAAHARAQRSRWNFLTIFWIGVGAASVAGLCVVALVWNAERFARQRSQFAASAAHELRTPLAGLRMYSEMLAEGLGDPARSKDYARHLADEAARLGRLVANVLGFTRLERGTLNVRIEPGDLTSVVRDCVERQRPALEAAGATVELTVARDVPEARFDRDAVAEIVQNLLDNAEKHTRNAADRTIHVLLTAHDHNVTLSVRDHGPGVSPAMRRRLFRPFTRGNHGDAPAGLGLGLVLVKALARAHDGEIAYADATDGGAVFTVTLPR